MVAAIIAAMTALEARRPFRLTDLTDCGGCAAKLGADLLAEALAGLGRRGRRPTRPTRLIAGLDPPDDAAVYRVSDDLAIIGTLDFFPPLVDDPRTFGEIAAANALSDVFAMGGRVLFALSIAAFPEDAAARRPDRDLRGRLVQGPRGRRHARRRPHDPRSGAEVRARGHRRGAPGPAAAQGRGATRRPARPDEAARDRRPRLRRAPGTHERGGPGRRDRRDATPQPGGVGGARRAAASGRATDVTGFGLLGHGLEMARASGTRFVFEAAALPALAGALELAAAGVETDGAAHNRRYVAGSLEVAAGVPSELVTLAHDPQTSGGLLAAVPPDLVAAVEGAFDGAGVERWWIGHVTTGAPGLTLAR